MITIIAFIAVWAIVSLPFAMLAGAFIHRGGQ